MYRRFLNNKDYIGVITEEALQQITRGKEECFSLAEEAAETSIVEYLIDNYEIEKELAIGKNILPYTHQITYPAGAHFYHNGKIYTALRSIAGIKKPNDTEYWVELTEYNEETESQATQYSQLKTYSPEDIVRFSDKLYECLEYNGFDYMNIRIPGINAWERMPSTEWEANVEYKLWVEPVSYKGKYYALISDTNLDLTINPYDSDNWGLIGMYDENYAYSFENTEYVEYKGDLWVPIMNPCSDALQENYNIIEHDPRNPNIKKHMVRLALYELHKLISPNNISSSRISDYETSIAWLRDANRLRINPKIERRLDEENKPVTEYAIATFTRNFNPYESQWLI